MSTIAEYSPGLFW